MINIGWVFLILTYIFILFSDDAKKDKKILLALLFVISVHHAIALTNAYVFSTAGANVDAATFHHDAVGIATNHIGWTSKDNYYYWDFGIGAQFYRIFLAFFYKIFSPSLLLGEELSVLAFLGSCYVLIKIYRLMGFSKHIYLLVLLYGCLPSLVLLSSVTLRESWEILSFMLAVYFGLQALVYKSKGALVYYLIFIGMMALLHVGLFIFAFFLTGLLACFYAYSLLDNKKVFTVKFFPLILMLCCALGVIGISYQPQVREKFPELEALYAISDGKVMSFIESYRRYGMTFEARTSYHSNVNASSVRNFITSYPPVFLNYMFAPFPWKISNLVDLYAALESLLRFGLFVIMIVVWGKTKRQKRETSFLLLTYLLLSVVWSLGTINYGTSIRHHLVPYWILVLFLGFYLSKNDEQSA